MASGFSLLVFISYLLLNIFKKFQFFSFKISFILLPRTTKNSILFCYRQEVGIKNWKNKTKLSCFYIPAAPAQTDTALSGSTAWTCAVSASESTLRTSDSRSWTEPFPVFVLHLNDFFISMMYRFVVQENRNVQSQKTMAIALVQRPCDIPASDTRWFRI